MLQRLQSRPAACRTSQLRQQFAPGAPTDRRSLVQLRILTRQRATEDEFGEDLSDIMKADMERFAKRQQQQQPSAAASAASEAQAAGGSPLKEAVDKVLIADFFFVLAVLAWLGVGLVEKGALHSSNLIDAWMPLWPMVFQPAIGILMAGALVSGGLNWLASRGSES